jgi:hypothetical protein
VHRRPPLSLPLDFRVYGLEEEEEGGCTCARRCAVRGLGSRRWRYAPPPVGRAAWWPPPLRQGRAEGFEWDCFRVATQGGAVAAEADPGSPCGGGSSAFQHWHRSIVEVDADA